MYHDCKYTAYVITTLNECTDVSYPIGAQCINASGASADALCDGQYLSRQVQRYIPWAIVLTT